MNEYIIQLITLLTVSGISFLIGGFVMVRIFAKKAIRQGFFDFAGRIYEARPCCGEYYISMDMDRNISCPKCCSYAIRIIPRMMFFDDGLECLKCKWKDDDMTQSGHVDLQLLVGAVACVVVALLILVVPWITQSFFEARSYNRVTGANVSTWDAMWVELRIDGTPKEAK